LVHRHFRPTGLAEVPVLGRGALTRLQAEVNTWRDRQQMGTRRKVATVHAFGDWWEKYHEKFPEIFATLPEGMVHPCPTAQRVNLCVSNPKVEQLILEEWREAGRPDRWSVSPNDGQGYCVCRNCRALDVPDTLDADPLDIFWNRNVVTLAGRYLNLWGRLLTTMRKENPDVWLVSLAYANYRNATPGMEPLPYDDALVVTWLPDNWWAQSEYEALAQWQRVGAQVSLWTNWPFVGPAGPYLPLHGQGRFLKHLIDNDILGWYQNLLGFWGTQGPLYYLTTRLCNRPDLTVDQVLDEYASAFGEGAPAIAEYLAYWEKVTDEAGWPDWSGQYREPGGLYERSLESRDLKQHPFWGSWYVLPFVYTDLRLAEARAILDKAEKLAGDDDPMVTARIGFLRDGLDHLELTRDVVAMANAKLRPEMTGDQARKAKREFERNLVRLRNMRVDMTDSHVVWADSIAWYENWRKIKMSDRFGDGWGFTIVRAQDWGEWTFRKDENDQGVDEEWYKPGATQPAAWMPITVPAVWDDTDVGSYQGYGWYQVTFRMPEQYAQDKLLLTFGAVDEQAWIYLNGNQVGEHSLESESGDIEGFSIGDLWNVPFTVEVPTDQLNLGGDNHLAVRVHNRIGAGGIWGRVTVNPPAEPLFVDTDQLGPGTTWKAGREYDDFAMSYRGSGRAEVTVDGATQGVIMEAGADGAGWALYMYDGNLYFQGGKGTKSGEKGQAVIKTPLPAGRHRIEWSIDQTRSRAMLRVDGKIVGDCRDSIYKYIAGGDAGGIGGIHGGGMSRNAAGWYRGEAANFTGTIHSATVWPDKACF
jgi:hypothetical protein